jgi:hypothetical protein
MAAAVGVIGVLVAPAVAHAATTYTVDRAAGGGCTPADPNCGSITAAAGVAAPGDTVQIRPGFYNESPTFNQGNLTVKGIGLGIVLVAGQVKATNAQNFTISRLLLESADTTPLVITGAGFPLVTDNIVVEGSTLLSAKALPALSITASTVATQTVNATVRHVTAASPSGPSISFTSSGGGTFTPVVKNSIALGGVDPASAAAGGNDDTSPFSAATNLFCDSALHLKRGASAIGAGGSLDAGEVAEDIDGEARGATPDRGGDQYSNKCDPVAGAPAQLPPTPVLTPAVTGGPAAPTVTITKPKQGDVLKRTASQRRGSHRKPKPKAVSFTGTAADPLGLVSVQLALRKTGGGTAICQWFDGRKLAKVPCAQVILLQATLKDRNWSYKIPASAKLPKGSYLLYATAINRAGVAATTFSQSAGNVVSFKVK